MYVSEAGIGANKYFPIHKNPRGVLAHGMTLFNKYLFHDDATLFDIRATYSSGRWMLGFL